MLRRFGVDPDDKRTHVWRLDKKTGRPERANPTNEAVIGRYYRITRDDGSIDDSADEALDAIEGEAADVIRRVARSGYSATAEDVGHLLLFAVTLKQRTPQGREAIREMDVQIGKLQNEVSLQNRERFYEVMKLHFDETEDELEVRRGRMLEDLRSGRVQVRSTPSREVAVMFSTLAEASDELFEKLGCVMLRAPADGKSPFIVSDHPVTHYDPDRVGESPGFLPGPKGGTLVPLDPAFALVFVSHTPGAWRDVTLTRNEVDGCNLLTYAWAREAIYGPSQEAVTRVRQNAKRNPRLLGEFAPTPPRLWVADLAEGERAGWHTFTSTSRGNTQTRKAYISPKPADAPDPP